MVCCIWCLAFFLFSLTMILLLMTAAINRAHSRCAKRHSFDNDMSVMCARVISTLQLSKCASLNCRMKKKETSNANCCHILASDSNFTGFYVISNFEEKKTAIQSPSKFQCDHFFCNFIFTFGSGCHCFYNANSVLDFNRYVLLLKLHHRLRKKFASSCWWRSRIDSLGLS